MDLICQDPRTITYLIALINVIWSNLLRARANTREKLLGLYLAVFLVEDL
jgi:hypothetical protein